MSADLGGSAGPAVTPLRQRRSALLKRITGPSSVAPGGTTAEDAADARLSASGSRTKWARRYQGLGVVFDMVLSGAAAALAVLVAFGARETFASVPYLVMIGAFPLAWVATQALSQSYEARYLGLGPEEFKRVVRGGVSLTAVVCFVWAMAQLDLSRQVVGLALPLATVATLTGRFCLRKVLHHARYAGRSCHRVLVVGHRDEVVDLIRTVRREPHAGFRPVGACLTGGPPRLDIEAPAVQLAGRLADVTRAIRELDVDVVAVCGTQGVSTDELRQLSWDLEGSGVALVVAPALTNVAGPRVHVRPVAGLPLLHVEEPVLRGPSRLLKASIDRSAAAAGLVLLAPLLAAVSVWVAVSSPGPVFFRQERIGRYGEPFRVWKFRTMYADAEARLADLRGLNESGGLLFKIRADPRITPAGRWLRRFSLDEIPQLINVLTGDMSLVGPRPLPTDSADYQGKVRRRLLVRPGMTGLWQVSGRSNLSWEDSVRLDLYYVDNWSLMFDLMILWKTFFVVARGAGAY